MSGKRAKAERRKARQNKPITVTDSLGQSQEATARAVDMRKLEEKGVDAYMVIMGEANEAVVDNNRELIEDRIGLKEGMPFGIHITPIQMEVKDEVGLVKGKWALNYELIDVAGGSYEAIGEPVHVTGLNTELECRLLIHIFHQSVQEFAQETGSNFMRMGKMPERTVN